MSAFGFNGFLYHVFLTPAGILANSSRLVV